MGGGANPCVRFSYKGRHERHAAGRLSAFGHDQSSTSKKRPLAVSELLLPFSGRHANDGKLWRNISKTMINQQVCPFCRTPALTGCEHLAVAAEGRDFVRQCVALCQGERQWRTLRAWRHRQGLASGEWSPEREDYTWLETAFCDEFLKRLRWFGGMTYEWRSGLKPAQAGFWVLMWSKDPQRLWWELHDEFERQASEGRPKKVESPKPEVRRARVESRRQASLRL